MGAERAEPSAQAGPELSPAAPSQPAGLEMLPDTLKIEGQPPHGWFDPHRASLAKLGPAGAA